MFPVVLRPRMTSVADTVLGKPCPSVLLSFCPSCCSEDKRTVHECLRHHVRQEDHCEFQESLGSIIITFCLLPKPQEHLPTFGYAFCNLEFPVSSRSLAKPMEDKRDSLFLSCVLCTADLLQKMALFLLLAAHNSVYRPEPGQGDLKPG